MKKTQLAYKIDFNGGDLSTEQFYVLSFKGGESLNEFYTFNVNIISTKSIDPDKFIKIKNRNVKLQMDVNGETKYVHGICMEATMKNMINEALVVYEIKICHPLSKLSIGQTSKVFLDMTIEEVISSILKSNEFTQGADYSFELNETKYDQSKENYEEIDFICQYNESSFRFIQRWMAEFGINMFFESTEDGVKVVFTDHNSGFKTLKNHLIEYYPSLANRANNVSIITEIEVSGKRVHLSLFYANNDLSQDEKTFEIEGVADDEDSSDSEKFTRFGGTPFLQKNSKRYRAIEEERFKSVAQTISIKSDNLSLSPGFRFEVENHHFLKNSKPLLVVAVKHEGNQLSLLKQLEIVGKDLLGYNISDDDNLYKNSLIAVDSSNEYRAPRLKNKRVNGFLLAEISGEDGGGQVHRTKDGNYQVKFPFEIVSNNNLHSGWIPRLGDSGGKGQQIALKKGDKIVIGFIEGSPNRPVIVGEMDQRGTILEGDVEMVVKYDGYLKVVGKDSEGIFERHLLDNNLSGFKTDL